MVVLASALKPSLGSEKLAKALGIDTNTHGYFNARNPLLSGLELEPDGANDGRLEVHEILGLSLDADLVTLSACETGMGSGYFNEIPSGDEFVSLTRAFLLAGSRSVLATLTPREERVLRMRFGIGEKADHTLEEVGRDFSVTRERIRQIEAKALRKLRHPSRAKKLKAFVDS